MSALSAITAAATAAAGEAACVLTLTAGAASTTVGSQERTFSRIQGIGQDNDDAAASLSTSTSAAAIAERAASITAIGAATGRTQLSSIAKQETLCVCVGTGTIALSAGPTTGTTRRVVVGSRRRGSASAICEAAAAAAGPWVSGTAAATATAYSGRFKAISTAASTASATAAIITGTARARVGEAA